VRFASTVASGAARQLRERPGGTESPAEQVGVSAPCKNTPNTSDVTLGADATPLGGVPCYTKPTARSGSHAWITSPTATAAGLAYDNAVPASLLVRIHWL
jgi:hypothetical protein